MPVAYISVRGDTVPGGGFDVSSLRDQLPEVPPFLQPVTEEELRVPAAEARVRGVREGSFRTRAVAYSGWGGAGFPLVRPPLDWVREHSELERLTWLDSGGTKVLLPNMTRTMAINSRFDLLENPEPPPPRKFARHDPTHPRVLVDTAEEWALFNNSISLWANFDLEKHPQPGAYKAHRISYPITRAQGQARNAEDPQFAIATNGADHPFHIHINPCWVMRIEIPDENGELHDILDEPRWLDTIWIPRGGRVVFRSRFADYTGIWVHHCHLLLHEDNGMMQVVEATERARESDYSTRAEVATHGMSSTEVDRIHPMPSLELAYRQSIGFIDDNPGTGQVYPGFEVDVPSPRRRRPRSSIHRRQRPGLSIVVALADCQGSKRPRGR